MRLSRSSAAGFAILTEDEAACQRIINEIKSWPEVFQEIAMHEDPEVGKFRVIFSVILNQMILSKDDFLMNFRPRNEA